MPPSRSKPPQAKGKMVSQSDMELLARQLKDATDLTKSLSKSLSDEVLLNAKARMEFKKDIEHLCEVVGDLKRIYSGNGKPPLEVRLTQLESDLRDIKFKRAKDNEIRTKKSERFWKFITQNSPVILTWLGLATWAILQIILSSKGSPPLPGP